MVLKRKLFPQIQGSAQSRNPYAVGFAMMEDIKRIASAPTKEDEQWFPELSASIDWRMALKADLRDESFIRQYLSPSLIRHLKLFVLKDDTQDSHYSVSAIHDDRGYERVREVLARTFDLSVVEPDIQVTDANLRGDRQLRLEHRMRNGIPLAPRTRDKVLKYVRQL